MKQFFQEYSKHTALNLGQAFRDIRHFNYHPISDKIAKEGTFKHQLISMVQRTQSLGNNLLFSLLPPHWHHSKNDLELMPKGSHKAWFLYGYKPWEFPDPSK